MNTYALIVKKTYTDLTTQLFIDRYDVEKVFDSEEEAYASLPQYDVYIRLMIDKIDTNGVLKGYETKVLSLEGELTKEQVQAMLTAAPDMLWGRGKSI